MIILLIGGTGFIGRHLVKELENDYELVLLHRGTCSEAFVKKHASIIADRRDLVSLRETLEDIKPEIVVDVIPYFAQDAWDVAITFRQISSKVIALSSGDVYRTYEVFRNNQNNVSSHASLEEDPLREKLFPYRGIDPSSFLLENYDKILVESILQHQKEFDTTILRLGALYGAFDGQRKLEEYTLPMLRGDSLLGIDAKKANWKWTRSYVKDAVKAIRLAIEQEEASRNEIFNVGEEHALAQIELVQKLKELTNWKGKITIHAQHGEEDYNYDQHLLLNTRKIRTKLGYTEQHTVEEGLTEAIYYEKRAH